MSTTLQCVTKEIMTMEESEISVIRVKNIFGLSDYNSRVIFYAHLERRLKF